MQRHRPCLLTGSPRTASTYSPSLRNSHSVLLSFHPSSLPALPPSAPLFVHLSLPFDRAGLMECERASLASICVSPTPLQRQPARVNCFFTINCQTRFSLVALHLPRHGERCQTCKGPLRDFSPNRQSGTPRMRRMPKMVLRFPNAVPRTCFL